MMEKISTLVYTFSILFSLCSAWYYTFETCENMNNTKEAHVLFDLRPQRINRSALDNSLTGSMTMREIFARNPEKYFLSMRFYFSPLGNNQYMLTPMRVPKRSFCDYVNSFYREYLMEQAKPPVSNLPYSDDPNVDLCHASRADHDLIFTVNKYALDRKALPKELPGGSIKAEVILERDDVIVGGIWVVLRVVADANHWRNVGLL